MKLWGHSQVCKKIVIHHLIGLHGAVKVARTIAVVIRDFRECSYLLMKPQSVPELALIQWKCLTADLAGCGRAANKASC